MSEIKQKSSATVPRHWRWGRFALVALPTLGLFSIGAAVGSIWATAVLAAALALGLYLSTQGMTRPAHERDERASAAKDGGEEADTRYGSDGETVFGKESML